MPNSTLSTFSPRSKGRQRRAMNSSRASSAGKGAFPYQIALARFDLAQGKADDSIKQLQQLIASASSTEDGLVAKNTLANIYMSQNKIALAEPLVTEILRTDARNSNALRLRAAIHLDRGKVDDAIADLRSALNDQPRSPELQLALATAYERNGSIELAGKAFFDADEGLRIFTSNRPCLRRFPAAARHDDRRLRACSPTLPAAIRAVCRSSRRWRA